MENHTIAGLLRVMWRIRIFEEQLGACFLKGQVPGFLHLYIGEEAVAAGVCGNLAREDHVVSTHRGHGHCIAKGADLNRLMAEIWGKSTGYCSGRGGSMHIFIRELGFFGTTGIVGAGLPLAVGAAMHARLTENGSVSVCFFGDGAANNGTFHESLNLAGVQCLPVVFVCENNLYATVTAVGEATKTVNFAERAAVYGMPGIIADGMDVLDVFRKTRTAVERARGGKGPTLLECKTYRFQGHYVGEPGTGYRTKKEVEEWKKKDPILRLADYCEENAILKTSEMEAIERDARKEVDESIRFAMNSPYPDPATAGDNVQTGKKYERDHLL